MTPIRVYIIPRAEVEDVTRADPLPADYLREYLSVRPGILDDGGTDIFCPNCRSEHQRWAAFELFETVDSPSEANAVVLPGWLELFEQHEKSDTIRGLIEYVLNTYDGQVVFQWNHDHDAVKREYFDGLPDRAKVIQFNTSKPTDNDILVPFWTINTNPPREQKRYTAGFIGYVGSIKPRSQLEHTCKGKPGVFWSRVRMNEHEYLKRTSEFKYSLCPRGCGLNSYRFYESMHCGCIPVLFADDAALPYPDLDYSEFSIRLSESSCSDWGAVSTAINESDDRYDAMMDSLEQVRERFSLAGVQREIYRRLREAMA